MTQIVFRFRLFNGLYGTVLYGLLRVWVDCMKRRCRPNLRLLSLFYLRFAFMAMTVKEDVYWTGLWNSFRRKGR
jgi:hypothetical protein